MKHKLKGFTIVELLIVIVVIGILAAISIVAYNGVTQRAESAKTVSALSSWKKIISQHYALNGKYFTEGGICLGDQYPILSGTTAGCRRSNAVLPNMSATQKNALSEVTSSFPMPSTKKFTNSAGTIDYMGMWFYGPSYNYKLDGKAIGWIQYVYDDTSCPETAYTLATSAGGGYDAIASTTNRYESIAPQVVTCMSPVL